MWRSEHSAETTASPAAVWRLFTDADGWPSWNPGLSGAHLDGPCQIGTSGQVKLPNGMVRKFTILEVEEETALVYGDQDRVLGARQRFLYRITPLGEGRTRVTLGHTIEGPTSLLFGNIFGRIIRGYLPTAAKQLVASAEGKSTGLTTAPGHDVAS